MKLTIGFSPCPNDTFIFDALVNKKIDTGVYQFEPLLEDVQTLNEWALEGRLAITKLSYGVLPLVLDKYKLLSSGSALGRGVGPLLIENGELSMENMEEIQVAIPGRNTTAHLLFSLAYPTAKNKVFLRYDEIEDFVLKGNGLGVIIHENRFTYETKGLKKITDLGDFWEKQTGVPIPLGGIVIDKNLPLPVQQDVDGLIRKSIEYAFSKYPELNDYIRCHAQEMSEEVMRKHIDLYVNDYSFNLGADGRNAVIKLMEVYAGINKTYKLREDIFV
ncbi:MAG: 1,4-dihydroxy-6-naphthoate synthase [Ferruginibacter sp.]